jgi:hypothetical protein
MAFPRLTGLQHRKQFQQQIAFFGRVAASVPMFEAQVPWAQPLAPELASELLQRALQH